MTVATRVRLRAQPSPLRERGAVRLALLGLGQVGSAVARLLHEQPALRQRFAIDGALVRDAARSRGPEAAGIPLTTDGTTLLSGETGVVVEALGGLEPARSLLLAALERGLPVVTANKSLVAAHGDDLLDAARLSGAPLYDEATVIAGVPFLGPLGRRPLAGDVTALTGIVNGTSNYILTRMAAERSAFGDVLADAQASGYAEPDPASDVRGIDAVEKLCVLLRHFGSWSVRPSAIETTGIDGLIAPDLEHARWFGGSIRPIVSADWRGGEPEAFAGSAFVDPSARSSEAGWHTTCFVPAAEDRMAYRERNPMLGAIAGAIGGLAGSWAMVQFNHLIRPNSGAPSDRPGDRSAHRRVNARPNNMDATIPDEPGSIQTVEAVAEPVLGRELTEREKDIGGSAVHYLFGATVGAMYGASAEIKPETAAGAGIPFGTTVWLVADEMGMTLAGFATNPLDYPASRHAAAFGSHVVFGLTVEGVRRVLRGRATENGG